MTPEPVTVYWVAVADAQSPSSASRTSEARRKTRVRSVGVVVFIFGLVVWKMEPEGVVVRLFVIEK